LPLLLPLLLFLPLHQGKPSLQAWPLKATAKRASTLPKAGAKAKPSDKILPLLVVVFARIAHAPSQPKPYPT
jgi:hypothetical protein